MVDKPRSFQDVLGEAIDDLTDFGFDSVERVERWKRALIEAAAVQAGDPLTQEQLLRDALAAIYKRQIDQLAILRRHKGVPRFTIENVKPQLRAELDRRLYASANLIKLNRQKAMATTMQRWEGWATSMPPGGVAGERKAKIKDSVKKSLAQLPFEERRVAIDQGHKMVAALSEIIASDGGAIAGVWHSHYRQAGYDYREDHKHRDGKIYLIRDSWAHKAGLVKRTAVGYYDEITAVGQEPFCRCYMTWLYSLSALPEEMLTQKGRRALTEVGMHMNASRAFARADDAEPWPLDEAVLHQVVDSDQMGYLRFVREVHRMPNADQWHSDEDHGLIRLEPKFYQRPALDQAHTFLHEVGHAGAEGDPDTWAAFQRQHQGIMTAFESMANPTHLDDFKRKNQVEGGVGAEAFAESYARFCLGLAMPSQLKEFWISRVTGKMSPRDARYTPYWMMKTSRCIRCSMFQPGISPTVNSCTAVAGNIAIQGHCRLFEISSARADDAEPWPEPKVGYAALERQLGRIDREIAKLKAEAS